MSVREANSTKMSTKLETKEEEVTVTTLVLSKKELLKKACGYYKWPRISPLRHMIKKYKKVLSRTTIRGTTVDYRLKIKLHGSNCAVIVQRKKANDAVEPKCLLAQSHPQTGVKGDGRDGAAVYAQSRTQMITNTMVAKIVCKSPEFWTGLVHSSVTSVSDIVATSTTTGSGTSVRNSINICVHTFKTMHVFGEYCGGQRGVACSQLGADIFAVFALLLDGQMVVDPSMITHFLTRGGAVRLPKNVCVIPWEDDIGLLKFNPLDKKQMRPIADKVALAVEAIEKEDPYIKREFGVSGVGEGCVGYPTSEYKDGIFLDPNVFSSLAYKEKGKLHRVVEAKPAALEEVASKDVEEFVAQVMLPMRMEGVKQKIFQDVGEPQTKKEFNRQIERFIREAVQDVHDEEDPKLKKSKFEWSQVDKHLARVASKWIRGESATKFPKTLETDGKQSQPNTAAVTSTNTASAASTTSTASTSTSTTSTTLTAANKTEYVSICLPARLTLQEIMRHQMNGFDISTSGSVWIGPRRIDDVLSGPTQTGTETQTQTAKDDSFSLDNAHPSY